MPAGHEIKKIDSTHWELVKIENYLPKTWEEFCQMHPVEKSEVVIDYYGEIRIGRADKFRDPRFDRTHLPNEKIAKAMRALCQLIQLRDFYNGDWLPDWKDKSYWKYSIWVEANVPDRCMSDAVSSVLTFKTEELRDQFLENFRDLIEIAKPLL